MSRLTRPLQNAKTHSNLVERTRSIPHGLRRLIREMTFLVIAVSATWMIARFFYRDVSIKSSGMKKQTALEVTMRHQYLNAPAIIYEAEGPLNNCAMLQDCFPEAEALYKNTKACHDTMLYLQRVYDNSIVLMQGKSIGYITFHLEVDPDNSKNKIINIYNVCVAREHRNKGIAKRMLEEGLEAMLDHYNLRGAKVLLGLDVELTTYMAAESFAMYAKMGFMRAWQPCRSVGDVDWRPIFNNPTVPAVQSPLNSILMDRERYLDEEIREKKQYAHLRSRSRSTKELTHFCMFKFYGESWYDMGKALAAPHQSSSRGSN